MVVGTFLRKQDGVWYFTTTSKATLNLDDQPVSALIYETDFTATAENVAMMKDNKSRVGFLVVVAHTCALRLAKIHPLLASLLQLVNLS